MDNGLSNGEVTAIFNVSSVYWPIFQPRLSIFAKYFYITTNYIYEKDVFMLNSSYNLNKLSGQAKLPKSDTGDKEF